MAIVVSRLLGTVCRSSGGPLGRARRRRHVWVLRIPGDVSTGRWRGYFAPTIYVRPDVMRHVLDPQLARLCVEGGAPYLHACGMPPYAPDAFDTPDTHPAVPYP